MIINNNFSSHIGQVKTEPVKRKKTSTKYDTAIVTPKDSMSINLDLPSKEIANQTGGIKSEGVPSDKGQEVKLMRSSNAPVTLPIDFDDGNSMSITGFKTTKPQNKTKMPMDADMDKGDLWISTDLGSHSFHSVNLLDRVKTSGIVQEKPPINPRNARVIEQAFDILKGNRVTIKGHTFTTPSKINEADSHLDYAGKEWLWDSAFHAMILAKREPEIAKEELKSIMANQHEDGFVPHMNYFNGDGQDVPEWAKTAF